MSCRPKSALALLAALLCASLGAWLPAGAYARAEPARGDAEQASYWSPNAVARVMAGLPPLSHEQAAIAQTQAWKDHSAATQAMWETLRTGRAAAITAFARKDVGSSCPAGKTLLYPFSGPDFLNAWWLFPGCEAIVMFGLEHVGRVPRLEALSERDLAQFMKDLRSASTDLLDRNYFITSNMSRQLHTPQLRGVLPMIMTSMALSGLEILSVTPLVLERAAQAPADATVAEAPDAAADRRAAVKMKSMRKPKGVTVEFRAPDSRVVRRLVYFSVDASDGSMAMYPEFLAYLDGLGTTTTLLKSASYLLHAPEFSRVLSTLLSVSGFLVQDDTGIPYKTLLAHGWDMTLRGSYSMPIAPFQGAYQPALSAAYEQQHPGPLAFDFGYHYRDRKSGHAMLMIGRRAGMKVIASSVAGNARAALRATAAARKH